MHVNKPRIDADGNALLSGPVGPGLPRVTGLAGLLVCLLTLATFLPALRCGFVNWDDDLNIVENVGFRGFDGPHLKWMFTTFFGGHYQPLTWLTFAADHAVWRLEPVGYHLTNAIWHAVGALLFFVLALRLLRMALPAHAALPGGATVLTWCAAFAALVFSVHPLRVESVAWVTERRDVVSGVLFFACLLAYLRAIQAPRRAWAWHVLAWGCMALSLGAKAVGVTLPVIMLIIDVYPARRMAAQGARWGRLLVEKLPYVVLALAAGGVAVQAQQSAGAWRTLATFGPFDRMVTACYGVCFYLWKWIAPHELSPLYPLPADAVLHGWPYVLAVPAVGVLLTLIVLLRWRVPALAPAFLAYCVLLAPVSGIAQSGKHLVADRYSYLALLPFALLAGGGLMYWVMRLRMAEGQRGRTPAVLASLLVFGLALLTIQQIGVWRNSQSLWQHVLRLYPQSSVAAVNLGNVIAADDPQQALKLYERAVRSDPRDAKAYNGLGRVLLTQNQPAAALDAFAKAVELAPDEAGYRTNLGYTLAGFGRLEEAADAYRAALNRDAGDAAATDMLASLLEQLGRAGEARVVLEDGLRASPNNPVLAGDLAWLLATTPDDAVRDGKRAVEMAQALAERTGYEDPNALDTLAAAYAAAGKMQQAVATADAAIELAQAADDAEFVAALQQRRSLYESGQAYRQQ